jgi:CRP/FNR family cyclic AMP-dependent transcriptional regulator
MKTSAQHGLANHLSFVEEWEDFDGWSALQTYPPDTKLFHQGSTAWEVCLIKRGLVKLTRIEEEGHEIIVGLAFAGWLLGAAAVIIQQPYPVTAVTLSVSELRRMSAKCFGSLLEHNDQFSRYLHRMHSRELYDHVRRVALLGCISARKRLEQVLWHLIDASEPRDMHTNIRLMPPMKYHEIAELIAVTPPYLSKLLRELEDDNIIRRKQGWLVITDVDGLWH